MPITTIVNHERKEVDAVAIGPITYSEIENHLMTERNFEGLAYAELIDARDARPAFAAHPAQIRQIVALVRTLGRNSTLGPTAVLVSTDFAFGVMRLLAALVEDVATIRPFRDEKEARTWLAAKSIQ